MLTLRRSFGIATLSTLATVAALVSFGADRARADDTTFFAVLSGGNEVSGTGQANAGAPNGYGSGTVVFRNNQRLCYALIVMAIDTPAAAHIHRARAGTNGPIVVNFEAPASGNFGSSSGCVTVDAALAKEIRGDPAGFYINVHSAKFPAGAIRGQLF